jgi:hypothetical protein
MKKKLPIWPMVLIFRYLKTVKVMEKELNTVIGKDCSCNGSPTLRAKLISVTSLWCRLEVTPTMYNRNQWANISVGKQFKLPTSVVHNMYFF